MSAPDRPGGAGPQLRVVAGPAAGQRLTVEGALELGRGAVGPGRLGDDPELSRRHARISLLGDRLVVEDLGSTNGTRVNGRRIDTPTALTGDDRIELGATTLEVLAAGAGTSARAPAADAAPAGTPIAPTAPSDPSTAGVPLAPFPPRAAHSGDAYGAGHSASGSGWRMARRIAVAVALVLLAAVVALILISRPGKSTRRPLTAAVVSAQGTAYVETNIAATDQNSILALRYRGGSFRPLRITEYPTGGAGSADLSNSGVLDADQQVTVNAARTLLFAVNQGSDTIAAFHIAPGGALSPVAGSPFASGGRAPASLAVSGNILVVANKAQDGVRRLKTVAAGYATFTIEPGGELRPTGSVVLLPPGSSPTQVYVPPGGGYVFTTEESGLLRVLALSRAGRLTTEPQSPYSLPDSLFTSGPRPQPVWPAGLSSDPHAPILYTGIPNYGSIVAYDYDAGGRLHFDSEGFDPNAFLPCWSVVSPDGHWLYFANAGTDNVSVWDLRGDPRHPRLHQSVALRGGGNPWNLRLDPAGHYLYILTPRQVRQIPAGQGQLLHSLRIAPDGTLTEITDSPVPLPVALDTNPFGLAIVPDRRS